MNKIIRILIGLIICGIVFYSAFFVFTKKQEFPELSTDNLSAMEERGEIEESPYPLAIEYMRSQSYPGSEIVIEEILASESNYNRYIAFYKSEGLKIYALLTVPMGEKPKNGWPVIIFNHGYIPPNEYRTLEKYIAYTDAFSRNGYIVLKSDYRGHGDSEGSAPGGYGSPAYTIDILNALASIKKFKGVDSNKIGMWGHSMGGFITLRSMVISKDIKAGVIWGGVVASYPDLINRWRRPSTTPVSLPSGARRWRDSLVTQFGAPEKNPAFWNSISANSYLKDISGPVQLHHGGSDTSVPLEFSEKLNKDLKEANKESELFVYPEDDHNIVNNFNIAIQRSVEFFNKYLK
ncbi:MAG: alpha/beta fold hydrolase [bacterium]|nr:alpha/beta fold hydrolase [bacterium]